MVLVVTLFGYFLLFSFIFVIRFFHFWLHTRHFFTTKNHEKSKREFPSGLLLDGIPETQGNEFLLSLSLSINLTGRVRGLGMGGFKT